MFLCYALARFDLDFSYLHWEIPLLQLFGLQQSFFLALLAAGLALFFNLTAGVEVFPLIGLSRLLTTFIKEAKYLPDLATLNLLSMKGFSIQ